MTRSYKPWLPEHDAVLLECYETIPLLADLARRMDRSVGSVICRAHMLGLARDDAVIRVRARLVRETLNRDTSGIVASALAQRPDLQVAVSGWGCGA